jgi:hypothetical protein
MMAFPNLVGLILLAPLLSKLTSKALKNGLDKPFDISPEDLK